jgi:hypothetical protein
VGGIRITCSIAVICMPNYHFQPQRLEEHPTGKVRA